MHARTMNPVLKLLWESPLSTSAPLYVAGTTTYLWESPLPHLHAPLSTSAPLSVARTTTYLWESPLPHLRAPLSTSAPPLCRRHHHLPVGVPAGDAAEPRLLPALHQVDEPAARHLQTDRLEGGVAPLGHAQEQAGDELRDDGPSATVSDRTPSPPCPPHTDPVLGVGNAENGIRVVILFSGLRWGRKIRKFHSTCSRRGNIYIFFFSSWMDRQQATITLSPTIPTDPVSDLVARSVLPPLAPPPLSPTTRHELLYVPPCGYVPQP